MSTQKRFAGRVVLVTGGNSGIGFATARRLVDEGAHVIITGRDQETLKRAQIELGPNAEAIKSDTANLADITTLFQTIKARHGRIDALFANAGVAQFVPIEAVNEANFDQIFSVNVKGLFFTLQKALPLLGEGSAVVLTGSVLGSMAAPASAVYGASKAAVRSLARSFSAAFVKRGIRFNVLSPGPIETPIWGRLEGGIAPAKVDATKKSIAEGTPMKRYGTAEEAAGAAAFLLSPESSYVLGAELFVDGGKAEL